ncbi:hypothetical protein ACMYR3_08055 [Ampullimonas aquatilis]|uniref:hypothetical protein n=1 Tax=Ampullimonas aquatilis TaxID=1341549 RepID=UPI003C72F7CA
MKALHRLPALLTNGIQSIAQRPLSQWAIGRKTSAYRLTQSLRNSAVASVSSGHYWLDQRLPFKGWAVSQINELSVDTYKTDYYELLTSIVRSTERAKQGVVLVDLDAEQAGEAHRAAHYWVKQGISANHLIMIEKGNLQDRLWTAQQLLQCGSASTMILWGGTRPLPDKLEQAIQAAVKSSQAIVIWLSHV